MKRYIGRTKPLEGVNFDIPRIPTLGGGTHRKSILVKAEDGGQDQICVDGVSILRFVDGINGYLTQPT